MPSIDFVSLRQINAFDYLTRFEDFTVSAKSNKSWLKSHEQSGTAVIENHQTGITYLVRKDRQNSLEYRITTTDGTMIPTGRSQSKVVDLISFVAYLHNCDIYKAAQRIAENLPSIQNTPQKQFSPPLSSKDAQEQKDALSLRIRNKIMPLTDISYLQKRNIDTSVIMDPLFKGRIANFKLQEHANLCFNCYDRNDRVVTTCQRYFSGEKAVKQFPYFKNANGENLSVSTLGTLWRSNAPANPSILLFSESPEDALSYYQLHIHKLKGKTLVCSSLGTFRDDHTSYISSLCAQHQISKIILANDNDTAGLRFDLMALSAIRPFGSMVNPIENASVSLIENEKHQHINKLHFQFTFLNEHFSFADRFYSLLESNFVKPETKIGYSDGLYKSDDNKWHFDFFCKNDMTTAEDVLWYMNEADKSGFFNDHFFVDKPKDLQKEGTTVKSMIKDWNEFLKYYMGDIITNNKKNQFFDKEGIENIVIEKKKTLKVN